MENKRYWLFICDDYYPRGGIEDITGTYDTIEHAVNGGKEYEGDVEHEWHVVDHTTLEVVAWYSSREWRMKEPYRLGRMGIEDYKKKYG